MKKATFKIPERIINPNPIHLVAYPNKKVMACSKPITFTDNALFFDERCALFVELAQLLILCELQGDSLLVSGRLLLTQQGLLYMFYSHNMSDRNKLIVVQPQYLLKELIRLFYLLFKKEVPPL